MIQVRDAAFFYEKGRMVFSDVSLTVQKSELVSILGPNGAGKSTLLACLAGLQPLSAGQIAICGKAVESYPREDLARIVGFVPQTHAAVFDYTVLEFVTLGRSPHINMFASPTREDTEMAEQAIETMHIGHLRDKLYTRISGGERQLVLIARAIAQNPQILLLDEPTAHLDYGNQIKMVKRMEGLRNAGYTIITTTHFPDHVFMCCDQVAVIHENRLAGFGPPGTVLTEEMLEKIYGVSISLCSTPLQKRSLCVPDYDGLSEEIDNGLTRFNKEKKDE